MNSNEKNLQKALKGNASFSLLTGLILLTIPEKIGQVMNIQNLLVFTVIGIGLLLFVTLLSYTAFKSPPNPKLVKLIIIQDWAWVFGSAVILIISPFSISIYGNVLIGSIALVVMLFALLQRKYLVKS